MIRVGAVITGTREQGKAPSKVWRKIAMYKRNLPREPNLLEDAIEESLGLFPINQSFFPLKPPDLREILANLKATLVLTLGVSKGEVSDMNEFPSQLNPEFRHVPLP
jgi:hypothetical protein